MNAIATKEITNEWVRENYDKRFTVKFENGKELKNIKLFVGTNGSIGYLRGRQKRVGNYFPRYDNIESIVDVTKPIKEYTAIGNAKTILNKIHKNCWLDLQEQMQNVIAGNEPCQDFEWHFMGRLKFRNVASLLREGDRKRLVEAFENKTEYRWSRSGSGNNGRDLSLSTQIGRDGKFRAYFSSEYIGCGNGDYWLLLNPTTAIYYERD
jgi:hypothetical protein